MTTQPRHLHRLLPLFDPLLSRAPLVVKTDHGPAGRLQVGHDEAYSREQLSEVELHFRHYPTCCLPTGRLIQKALVPDHGLVARHRVRMANPSPKTADHGLPIRFCKTTPPFAVGLDRFPGSHSLGYPAGRVLCLQERLES